MECLLALCLYVEAAIGQIQDEDLAPATSEYGQLVESRSDWASVGHAAVGAERQFGRYFLYLEGEHRSIWSYSGDNGVNSAWAGVRVRF